MISTAVVPVRRDLDLMLMRDFGAPALAEVIVAVARTTLAEADAANEAAMGQLVPYTTFIDGQISEALERVRAGGSIVRVYHLLPIALQEIGNLLWEYSPVKSGAYQQSHRLLADGTEIAQVTEGWAPPAVPPGARELVFVPTVAYARLMEPVDGRSAWSSQAPDGVYHAVAELMQDSFRRLGTLAFGYRELSGVEETAPERRARPNAPRDLRQPAIIIRPS
jgi:hypothetical protein